MGKRHIKSTSMPIEVKNNVFLRYLMHFRKSLRTEFYELLEIDAA